LIYFSILTNRLISKDLFSKVIAQTRSRESPENSVADISCQVTLAFHKTKYVVADAEDQIHWILICIKKA